jgi:heat shock protein HspQ
MTTETSPKNAVITITVEPSKAGALQHVVIERGDDEVINYVANALMKMIRTLSPVTVAAAIKDLEKKSREVPHVTH